MSRLVELLEERAAPGAAPYGRRVADVCRRTRLAPRRTGRTARNRVSVLRAQVAPVSGVASLLDFDVQLTAELDEGAFTEHDRHVRLVTSLCPCSKEISAYGAHNQRSLVTVVVRPRAPVRSTELVGSPRRGVVRAVRDPEARRREVRHRACVRQPALRRRPGARRGLAPAADARFSAYAVEAENFESIHNHSAFARIARGW